MIKNSATSKQIFIDPVCFLSVQNGNNDLRVTYKFRTYYWMDWMGNIDLNAMRSSAF